MNSIQVDYILVHTKDIGINVFVIKMILYLIFLKKSKIMKTI
jgi:hypothetical protein